MHKGPKNNKHKEKKNQAKTQQLQQQYTPQQLKAEYTKLVRIELSGTTTEQQRTRKNQLQHALGKDVAKGIFTQVKQQYQQQFEELKRREEEIARQEQLLMAKKAPIVKTTATTTNNSDPILSPDLITAVQKRKQPIMQQTIEKANTSVDPVIRHNVQEAVGVMGPSMPEEEPIVGPQVGPELGPSAFGPLPGFDDYDFGPLPGYDDEDQEFNDSSVTAPYPMTTFDQPAASAEVPSVSKPKKKKKVALPKNTLIPTSLRVNRGITKKPAVKSALSASAIAALATTQTVNQRSEHAMKPIPAPQQQTITTTTPKTSSDKLLTDFLDSL